MSSSDGGDAAEDEEVLIVQEDESSSSPGGESQDIYIESGNDKKVLCLQCIGLNHPGNTNEPLFLFEMEPWSLLPKN
jgi:hypothetical protein